MISDPVRELVEMWQAIIKDGVEPGFALEIAMTVQRNTARARFERDVLADIAELPTTTSSGGSTAARNGGGS